MKIELEEAAENYRLNQKGFVTKFDCKEGFIRGAKWQQEKTTLSLDDAYSEGFENGKKEQENKLYSEDEVFSILTKFWMWSTLHTTKEHLTNWFEQFKKK